MAMTWDMHTSGPNAGQLLRPLAYTQTEDDATRVRVYLRLATQLGEYLLRMSEGLDHRRMLAPDATDAERAADVRAVVLGDPGVAEVIGEPLVDTAGGVLTVSAAFRTITGAIVTVGG